jgi:threonine dehydratase
MNFDRLRFVAERAELGEGREALLSVDIPEKPGRWEHIYWYCHAVESRAESYFLVSWPFITSSIHGP